MMTFGSLVIDEVLKVYKETENRILYIDAVEKYFILENQQTFEDLLQMFISAGWKILLIIRTAYIDSFCNLLLDTVSVQSYHVDPINKELLYELSDTYGFVASGDEGIARLEHGIQKIVTAVNTEDGKEYLTYFTKDTIVCKSTEENGETVWTMKLTEEQSELVNKYFENFEANNGEETKWYSGNDMGMVSSKGFWQGFFAGAETVDETQDISD